jgi:hypothetical protein
MPWMKSITATLALFVGLCGGCRHHTEPALVEKLFINIGLDNWKMEPAMGLDIHIETVGRPNFDARITEDVKSNRVRMQLADDTILVFDGQSAWVSPPTAKVEDARQILLNWPYLVTLPLRLREPGVNLGPVRTEEVGKSQEKPGEMYGVFDVTFGAAAMENANDHYTLYLEPKTGRLRRVIVWPKGDAKPYALTLYDLRQDEGVTFATEFMVWNYNATEGVFGKPFAEAHIYNVDFSPAKKNAFVAPAGARKAE